MGCVTLVGICDLELRPFLLASTNCFSDTGGNFWMSFPFFIGVDDPLRGETLLLELA